MLHLSSQIVAVTVYRKGARVTRVAELEVSEGGFLSEVALVDLPLTLDEGSVRLTVRGHGSGATPQAVSYHLRVSVPADERRDLPADEAELEHAALLQAQAEARVETLRATLQRMQQVHLLPRPLVEGGAPPPLPTDARLAWLVWSRERSAALHTELQAARIELRELTLRLETLKERHRERKQPRTFESRMSAIVRLRSLGSAAPVERISLQLSYDVPGARWSPAYTLRLNAPMAAGQLEMRAIVGQSTGEDWRGVALSLSTALPEPWTELPELKALRLGRAQPHAPTGWCKPPEGAEALYRDRDAVLGQPSSPRRSKAAAPITAMRSRAQESLAVAAEPIRAPVLELPAFTMPQPLAAPAPLAATPPVPAAAPASAAVPAPEVMMARSRMAAPPHRMSPGAAPPPTPPSSDPPPVAVDRALLNYGDLRLCPAQDSRRGKLRPLDRDTEGEAWRQPLEVALASARELEQRALPPGHLAPTPDLGFDYAYRAQAPVDIASDGRDHPVCIHSASIQAKPSYVSVPRASRDVFRWVRVVNPWDGPVLAGPVDVYVDGRFLQSSAMPLTHGHAIFELGLGVEASLKIARNVTFEEDTSGLLKRQHELRHRISIEVTNHLTHTASLEIRDRVPVPAENQADLITVELRSVDPPWVEYEPPGDRSLQGGRQWRIDVPAGQTRTAHALWVIMVPAQHELVGGNRREPA